MIFSFLLCYDIFNNFSQMELVFLYLGHYLSVGIADALM